MAHRPRVSKASPAVGSVGYAASCHRGRRGGHPRLRDCSAACVPSRGPTRVQGVLLVRWVALVVSALLVSIEVGGAGGARSQAVRTRSRRREGGPRPTLASAAGCGSAISSCSDSARRCTRRRSSGSTPRGASATLRRALDHDGRSCRSRRDHDGRVPGCRRASSSSPSSIDDRVGPRQLPGALAELLETPAGGAACPRDRWS